MGLGVCITLWASRRRQPGLSILQAETLQLIEYGKLHRCYRQLILADGNSSVNIVENLLEISDLNELKLPFRAMCRVAQLILPWNTSYTKLSTGSFIPLKKEEDNKENDTKQTTDSQPPVQASSPLAGPPISCTPCTTGQTSHGSSSQLNLPIMEPLLIQQRCLPCPRPGQVCLATPTQIHEQHNQH